MFTTILLMVVGIVVPQTVATIPTWNMHYSCDQTIGESELGGFLVFDSDLLPDDHQYECQAYIQPGKVGSGSGILFHFSDIKLGGSCEDTNLTIVDGEIHHQVYYQDLVPGLKIPVCGSNSSLNKDLMFASKNDRLILVFKRRRAYGSTYRAEFNMTFLSYFEGECDDYDDVFTCDNKRCISDKFVCLDLNPCGDYSDCLTAEEIKSILENILNTIKDYLYVIIGGVILFIAFKYLQAFRRKGGELKDLPIIGCIFQSLNNSSSSQNQIRRSSVSRTPERSRSRERSASVVMEESSLSHLSDDESTANGHARTASFSLRNSDFQTQDAHLNADSVNPTAPPPTYDDLDTVAPSVAPDVPAPPSYDEVMANSDKYVRDT